MAWRAGEDSKDEEQRRWPNHGEVGSAPVSGQRRKKEIQWVDLVVIIKV